MTATSFVRAADTAIGFPAAYLTAFEIQIRQHLFDSEPIPRALNGRVGINVENAAGIGRLVAQALDGIPDDLGQIEAFQTDAQGTCGDA